MRPSHLLPLLAAFAGGCATTLPAGTPEHCRTQYESCMDVCSQRAPTTWTTGDYAYGEPSRDADIDTMACAAACRDKALRCADVGPGGASPK